MQPFIKIGHRYIHTSMITDVLVQDKRPKRPDVHVEIFLAAPMGERASSTSPLDVQTRHLHVSGEDAEAFIGWLDAHATPLQDTAPPQDAE